MSSCLITRSSGHRARARSRSGEVITEYKLDQVLAGVTIVNDVSARDVQLPQGQFYRARATDFALSVRCWYLLEPGECGRWRELKMTLTSTVRYATAYCGEMLFKPHQT